MSFTGANVQKDPLCLEAFKAAGKILGKHVLAVAPNVNKVRTQGNN